MSVTFDPSGRFIAVGTTVGRFIILDAVTGSHVISLQLGTESLDVITFSPGETDPLIDTVSTVEFHGLVEE